MTRTSEEGRSPAEAAIVFCIPGLSLMDVRQVAAGTVYIGCPACGASEVVVPAEIAATGRRDFTFVHQDDDCPVKLQIEQWLNELKRAGLDLNFSLLWKS